MSWSEGYFSDLNYMHGYYKGLNPLWMRFICLFTGIEPPRVGPCNYLELGFGKGLSLGVHAAANTGSFWGVDFNASHAAHALELTRASQSEATILDDSFQKFAERTDLPQFDFIVLHGVWSWISKENRSSIVELLSKHLRVGGLVYVSYNAMPGWSPMIAVRELMSLHFDRVGRSENVNASIEKTIEFTKKVLATHPSYLSANPSADRFVERLTSPELGSAYIAHEYLNRDWYIPTFAAVAADLAQAKLSYAGSARALRNVDKFQLTSDQIAVVDSMGDQLLKETVRDYFLNTQFRSDIFIKGPRPVPSRELKNRWLGEYFVLTTDRSSLPDEISVGQGKVSIKNSPAGRIADILRRNGYRPKSGLEIVEGLDGVSWNDIIEVVFILIESSHVSPAQIPDEAVVERCRLFNRHVLKRAMVSAEIEWLASPVTGGGLQVAHLSLLFICGWEQGRRTPTELANFASDSLRKILDLSNEDAADLGTAKSEIQPDRVLALASAFLSISLPLLQALVVV
jgi:predicted O-methyltransferase YrrM